MLSSVSVRGRNFLSNDWGAYGSLSISLEFLRCGESKLSPKDDSES
jgi:hypothetical protein